MQLLDSDNISNVTFVLFLVINKDFLYLERNVSDLTIKNDVKKKRWNILTFSFINTETLEYRYVNTLEI